MMNDIYVGLGSNLDDPVNHIQRAIEHISKFDNIKFITASMLYVSASLIPDQPDFINAVVKLQTDLSAELVLDALIQLEQVHGRVRRTRWGPRTLDCDLLLYGKESINLPGLIVPHPEMLHRAFVLIPLYEIAPQLIIYDQPLQNHITPSLTQQVVKYDENI
jgi:2-amino-4-hydroxy-6-hydroxymethyldihydropteridine diphosphokinase